MCPCDFERGHVCAHCRTTPPILLARWQRDVLRREAAQTEGPNGYDTMRFLRAGIGSSVVGTGLTLRDILAVPYGVTLVYATEDGREVRTTLTSRVG